MKEQQKFEIKVGLTVLAGLIILLVGFYSFRNWSLGGGTELLEMRFPASAGLQKGDVVTVNGVSCGRVESVELLADGVRVRARMDEGVRVSTDARPVIQMLELMGGKKVEIAQGVSDRYAGPDDVLIGRVDPDISGALGMFGGVQGDVRDIAHNANVFLRNANTLTGDTVFIRALKDAAVNLRDVSADTRQLLAANRDDISRLLGRMSTLAVRVDTLLMELRPDARAALGDTRRVLARADTLLADLHDIAADLRNGRGLLNTAIHDTSLVTRLDRMLQRVDTLTAILINGELHIRASLW
jgi:phospholipid/cholesterol/gamma-HCH transport system substrate-binding protein